MEIIINNEDGSTSKFTEEMAVTAIKENEYLRTKKDDYYRKLSSAREAVYNFFKERYDTDDSEITCSVDDVNQLLQDIGSEKLKFLYTVSGNISFTIVDIEADDEEDAQDKVNNWLTLEYGDEGSVDDWNLEITDTNAQ